MQMRRSQRRAAAAAPAGGSGADESRDLWQPKEQSALRLHLGPLVLVLLCPLLLHYVLVCLVKNQGALLLPPSWDELFMDTALYTPNEASCQFLVLFVFLQATLLVSIPGKRFYGPRAPSGHVPEYTNNGFVCFWLTLGALAAVCCYLPGGFLHNSCFIYDNLGPLLTLLNISALLLCFALYFKGMYAPSTEDAGSSGSFAMSFYWGVELYPSILSVDLKQLIICRLGMMLWCLFVVSFCAKTCLVHGTSFPPNSQLVSSSLMFFYIAKFYVFEPEYLCAADIAVDRFGFMLCWGTLAFMPMIHSLSSLFLVTHQVPLSNAATLFSLVLGNACTYINYDSDTQRHRIRAAKGKLNVWGKPARTIKARYVTLDGKEHESLLSVCGYQGISRHFHYCPDIVNLFLYCAPCGFSHLLPFTYFFYLTALLIDRTYRIDQRCEKKYGKYWDQYVEQVPYRLIPGLW